MHQYVSIHCSALKFNLEYNRVMYHLPVAEYHSDRGSEGAVMTYLTLPDQLLVDSFILMVATADNGDTQRRTYPS
jgi:hypothetical protein